MQRYTGWNPDGTVWVTVGAKAQERYALYEDLNRTPEELADMIAELERYRAKGKPEELERMVHCDECRNVGGCVAQRIPAACCDENGYCSRGERREKE